LTEDITPCEASNTDPALRIARHDAGPLPAGWTYWTFRQYDDDGRLPGDQYLFNGSPRGLRTFARGWRSPIFRLSAALTHAIRTQAERWHAERVTAPPAPVHLPFTQVAYVPLATDVQQKPG
jgi:lysozyme